MMKMLSILLLAMLLMMPLISAQETTPSTDFFGWLYNSITGLWEQWFGGNVISTSTSISAKDYYNNSYQKIVTPYIDFELPKQATHYWNPNGLDTYEVIISNLSFKGYTDKIIRVTWNDDRYNDDTIRINYTVKNGVLALKDIIPYSVKKTSNLKFNNFTVEIGNKIGDEYKIEDTNNCNIKTGNCTKVNISYPIYSWSSYKPIDLTLINPTASTLSYTAIDDINVSACGTLSTANGVYNLNKSINVGSQDCITINADNITLNGMGYSINGSNGMILSMPTVYDGYTFDGTAYEDTGGETFIYYITPYKDMFGVRYYGTQNYYEVYSVYSYSYFDVNLTWNAVDGADGYRITFDDSYSGSPPCSYYNDYYYDLSGNTNVSLIDNVGCGLWTQCPDANCFGDGEFINPNSKGINNNANKYTKILNMTITNFYYGMWLNLINGSITNVVLNNNSYGLYSSTTKSSNFTSITANNNSFNGLAIYVGSNNNNFTNITTNNNLNYGVYLSSSSNNSLTNINVNNNTLTGIYSISGANYNNFTNIITNKNQYGIYFLSSSRYNTITNITANNNTQRGIFLNTASNNVFSDITSNNNPLTAIYMISNSNNNFFSNISLEDNGYTIQIDTSYHNRISNGIINSSRKNALEIRQPTANDMNLTITNINITNTNSSWNDLQLSGVHNTYKILYLVDTPIAKYNITGFYGYGSPIFIKKTNVGIISFNTAINGSGGNFSDDIKILNNSVYVNSSQIGLNKSANVTLYNLPTTFTNPKIIYNSNKICNSTSSPACSNFTSLNAGNVTFNVTSWSDYYIDSYVPPNCTIISKTPSDINDSSTGVLSVIINCTSKYGINTTKNGEHYGLFITRTVDAFILSAGIPNYWSNRYPNNSLGVVGTLTPPYKIWRALGRNEGYWYENINELKSCNGLSPCYQPLNDTFSYAIEDGDYGHFNVTNGSNWALINYTHPAVDISAFRQSVYLSWESMVQETKKNYTIDNNHWVLTKRFDAEAYRNTANYTMHSFRNFGVVGSPTKTLRAFYCNSSYNPSGSTPVLSSTNCALINSITPTSINTITFTDRNSSYSSGTYGITNGKFGGITATAEFYIEYETQQSAVSQYYQMRYVNGSTNTDVKFNETNVSWTSTDGGVTWVQASWTPDIFTTSTRATNDEFQFGLYVCDNLGSCFYNFTMIQDAITTVNRPISNPDILEYNSSETLNDIYLNGTHRGLMNIRIGCSKDADSVGNVTHNLTLRNVDGTWNYTINGSFKCINDAPTWINFNTSFAVPSLYKMNITATAGDNINDIKSLLTDNNFTILKQFSSLTLTSSAGWSVTAPSFSTITGTCNGGLTCNLYLSGTLVANPYTNIFPTGNYVFVYNTTGNANYTDGNVTNTLVSGGGITSQIQICKYKKYGYYNLNLPWFREENCI